MLLPLVPLRANLRVELAKRFELWFGGQYVELLVRIEEQARLRVQARGLGLAQSRFKARATRAKAMAREGAYSKAVTALTSEVAALSDPQQIRWATELLPRDGGTASSETMTVEQEHVLAGADGMASPEDVAGTIRSDRGSPLRGVRFPAMSAAGPSGTRPEHLREAIAVRSRPVANRLISALGEFIDAARTGKLPPGLRWITRSRLVFLQKKAGPKPRPIWVGEMLRRLVAKRLVHDHQPYLRRFFMDKRQYGVAIPGGADALLQFRHSLEAHFRDHPEVALVALDLDLVNAFPRFYWPAIRRSVAKHLPGLSPWTAWCQAEAAVVVLPCGEEICVDRGAEQGDPLGPAYCGFVLADVVEAAVASMGGHAKSLLDVWYMDGG